MATTFTHNLRLRLDSNLTANSKYNLERLDLLGGTFLVDTTDALNVRSRTDILIEPESADLNGSGVGGNVNIGTLSHQLSTINLNAAEVTTSGVLGLLDQAVGGTHYLNLQYKSDLSGAVDTAANRTLSLDLNGADRDLVLEGDFQLLGDSLVLNTTGSTNIVLPTSGTLSTLNGVETLTNKTISGLNNVLTNIPYSSLNLSGGITNSDIAANAGIAYSKLNLGGGIVNGDVSLTAAIVYSKLSLTNSITNTDISPIAGISGSKITADFGSQGIVGQSLSFNLGGTITTIEPAQSGQVTDLTFQLPNTSGGAGQVLSTDGAGNLSWASVTSVSPQNANLVYAGPASGSPAEPTFRALTAADISGIVGYRAASFSWANSDGSTKTISHGWNSVKIMVEVLDGSNNFQTIDISDITRPTNNTLVLTSNVAPVANWTVLLREVP